MQPQITYIIKVMVISVIMYSYYLIALRNKKFHRYNRFYLLSSLFLPLLLPFIQLDFLFSPENKSIPVILQRDMISDAIVFQQAGHSLNWESIIYGIYLVIAIVLIVLFLASIWRVYVIKRRGILIKSDDYTLVESTSKGTPFSFFRLIFWNPKIAFNSREGQQIFQHEMIHVRQLHSLDKLVVNVVQIVFWFNPVFWFIKREINIVHEFLADKASVEDADVHSFSKMALQAAYPGYTWPANNRFFYSPLKRRLAMLFKNKNQKVNYFGRLMVLPLLAGLFLFFTMKAKATKEEVKTMPVVRVDTVPLNSGVKSLEVVTPQPQVKVTWKNGKKETLTLEEAREKGLVIPPPPPPPAPPTTALDLKNDKMLYVLDGTIIDKSQIDDLSPNSIGSVTILRGKTALEKYGERAKDGVMEIYTKGSPADPSLNIHKVDGRFSNDTIPKDEKIFTQTDQPAQFPGGQSAWVKYIQRAIEKNLADFTDKDYGTCVVSFIVDKNGNVSNVRATTMQGTKLAEVAIDAIQKGPKWIPAQQNGHIVTAYRLQPVTLSNAKDDKVFTRVEKEAQFPGGPAAWAKYIGMQIQKHIDELGKDDNGTCVVKFIVDQNGEVRDVQATTMQGTRLAEIAVDAIRKGPKWIPAQQNGHDVAAYRMQPVTLKSGK